MVKIRLKRFGAKKNPHYRIVVTDSRRARDGAYLESLGYYDPRGNQEFTLDEERLGYWVKEGAHVSPRVNSLLKRKHEADGTVATAVKEKPATAPKVEAAPVAEETSNEAVPEQKPEAEVKTENKAEPQKEKEEEQQSTTEQVES